MTTQGLKNYQEALSKKFDNAGAPRFPKTGDQFGTIYEEDCKIVCPIEWYNEDGILIQIGTGEVIEGVYKECIFDIHRGLISQ